MKILALDTSSPACSVALTNGAEIVERHVELENQHSQFLLKFINEVICQSGLKLNDLDAVAVGSGPGSFTGLRLGMGVAQGLAFGINKPLIPVSSLHAIAKTSNAKNVMVAVDARMGEVYWQCFQLAANSELVAIQSAKLDRPENIVLHDPDLNWQGIGSGFDQYFGQLSGLLYKPDNWIKGVYPQARSILKLALAEIENAGMPSDYCALPVYVRNKVTH